MHQLLLLLVWSFASTALASPFSCQQFYIEAKRKTYRSSYDGEKKEDIIFRCGSMPTGYRLITEIAKSKNAKKMLNKLEDKDFDFNRFYLKRNQTFILFFAVSNKKNNQATVNLLKHTNINPYQQNNRGNYAIHQSAAKNSAPNTEVLLNHKIDLKDVRNFHGSSPLHLAVMKGHKEAAAILVEKGAELNNVDIYGRTPALLAAAKGHIDTARWLIAQGADAERVDILGNSIQDYEEQNHLNSNLSNEVERKLKFKLGLLKGQKCTVCQEDLYFSDKIKICGRPQCNEFVHFRCKPELIHRGACGGNFGQESHLLPDFFESELIHGLTYRYLSETIKNISIWSPEDQCERTLKDYIEDHFIDESDYSDTSSTSYSDES